MLEDLASGHNPTLLKRLTPEPTRKTINFDFRSDRYTGDLYYPAEKPLAAIALIPGAAILGKDDPRLVAFALTLARARFTVLVPDIPNLRALKISPDDTRYVSAAVAGLADLARKEQKLPLGIGAFSYAVGPAILATLNPETNTHVDFILSVGGYHDLNQVITYFTTGYFQVDGKWEYLRANEYGKWVFVKSNLDHLADPADRALFQSIVERKLEDPDSGIDDIAVNLHREGKALYRLLTNMAPEQTHSLISGLPPGIKNAIHQLNLINRNLGQIKAHLIIVHGKHDPIIPYTQSISLAHAFPSHQVSLFLIDGLVHVGMVSGKIDQEKLIQAVKALLMRRADD